MKLHRLTLSALAALVLVQFTGCQTTGPTFDPAAHATTPPAPAALESFTTVSAAKIKPEWLEPSPEPFRLGPGDKLELEVLGRSGTRAKTFICPDGRLYFDLLPGIDVWGLTLAEATARMEKELATFYTRPQLSLSLVSVESKRVWVLGRLNKSGIYPLAGPMTIIEAIARAGGLFTSRFNGTTEELADLNHSFIIRRGEMLPVNFQKLLRAGDTTQNIYLEPDDFIYLPSSLAHEVFVLGAVNAPRPVGFSDDMTVATALAKALGTTPEAQLSQVAIVRGSLANPRIAVVDFHAIVSGKAPDVRLEARDIVYVPTRTFGTLERYARSIADTFVRTVAANEGGRAVNAGFGGVGVSNPIGR